MKVNEYPVSYGGLMRCCIKTLEECEDEVKKGQAKICEWCGAWMILEGVGWKWLNKEIDEGMSLEERLQRTNVGRPDKDKPWKG